jgi:peptide deformylase
MLSLHFASQARRKGTQYSPRRRTALTESDVPYSPMPAKPMAALTILEYPDPRLRKIAAPVESFTREIQELVRDMADTMYAAPGIGLAATQVDVHKRVIVMDVSEARDELRVFINPEILAAEGEAEAEEGCLSVPGYYDKVTRAARVRVRARDAHGASFELDAEGMLAVCIQHEMEHLLGKVFVDHLSPLKQARLAARLRKKQRLAG